MSARDVYAFVAGRVDSGYVRETAAFVAEALREGIPIGVAFQPGDGTRYDLAFLPTKGLSHAPGRLVEGNRWPTDTDFGVSRAEGTALVSWYRHGAIGLDFRTTGFDPIWLEESFPGTTFGSICALAVLFEAIAEAFRRG